MTDPHARPNKLGRVAHRTATRGCFDLVHARSRSSMIFAVPVALIVAVATALRRLTWTAFEHRL